MLVEVREAVDDRARLLRGGGVVEPDEPSPVDALVEDGEVALDAEGIEDPRPAEGEIGDELGLELPADRDLGRRRPARRARGAAVAARRCDRAQGRPASARLTDARRSEEVRRQRRRGGRRLDQREGRRAPQGVGQSSDGSVRRSLSVGGGATAQRGGVVAAPGAGGRCPADPGACANSSAASRVMAPVRSPSGNPTGGSLVLMVAADLDVLRARRARRRSGPPPSSRATPGRRPPPSG